MVINNRTVLRSHLKLIYGRLSNNEKHQWAAKANYTDYKGLYKYITYTNGNREDAYPRVVNALIQVIGQERFNNLFENVSLALDHNSIIAEDMNTEGNEDLAGIANTIELKIKFVEEIFNCDNIEMLEEVRQNLDIVVRACNNQLDRLRIESEI